MFKGIYTPMVTIFNEHGGFDFDANGRLIDRLIDRGINGILFLGSIGEFYAMSMEEKKEFIRFAVKRVDKRTKAFIGTGGTSVDEVVALTQYAQDEGADAAVIISPYYFKLDESCLYRYYAQVAKSVKMPILLYNFPDRTGVDMSPQLVRRLALDFPNIVGLKDTVDNISHTRKVLRAIKPERADFCVLSGFDEYLIPNLMAGGDGILTGMTNIAPDFFLAIYHAYYQKDFETIAKYQPSVNVLMELYDVSQPFIPAIKGAVVEMVKEMNPIAKAPFGELNTEQVIEIRKILNRAGLLLG